MNHNGEKIERLMDPYLPLHNFYYNIYLKFVYRICKLLCLHKK